MIEVNERTVNKDAWNIDNFDLGFFFVVIGFLIISIITWIIPFFILKSFS